MIISEAFLQERLKTNPQILFEDYRGTIKHSAGESYDIFLSHSSLDKKLIYALYDVLTECGFKVYLDTEDLTLDPNDVTSKTGYRLREILKNCKCLAYVNTMHTYDSKWCPWELGVFDGISNGRCCILPISKTIVSHYSGQEFLGLYPYLSYEKYMNKEEKTFWVNDPHDTNKYISLKLWIEGKDLTIHN